MNKLLLIALFALAALAAAQSVTEEEPWWKKPLEKVEEDLNPAHVNKTHFLSWMKKYGKTFHLNDIPHRFSNWKKSVQRVWDLNKRQNATWIAGLNHLSAHTKDELKNLLGLKTDDLPKPEPQPTSSNNTKRFRPDWIDWTQRGAVTSVKDQGQCGSCWAFSATAALEGAMATSGHGLTDLSTQQIIDCAGLGQCQGGDPIAAVRWGGHDGMTSWGEYPYTAGQQGCHGSNKHIHCNDVATSWSGSDWDAAEIIAGGPTSICFHVQDDFFHYQSGVFGEYCPHDINHAVLAVGYARNCNNSGRDCYILKNQWGSWFGTGGYFLMEMGSNMCGIANYVARPYNCW